MPQGDILARLDAIQARADAATEGPWEQGDTTPRSLWHGKDTVICECDRDQRRVLFTANQWWDYENDVAFIAHARTDIPRLVAALRVAVEGLRSAHRDLNELPQASDLGDCIGFAMERVDNVLAAIEAALEGR